MEYLFEIAAGIDVHRDTVVVSVRKRKGRRDIVETRTFGTFFDELDAMSAWLVEEGVEVVGMESTGVYFKPVLLALRRGAPNIPAWLVNAAAVKQVPGRKTDVNDSAWLSKLVMHGLVRPSFLPEEAQEDLRLLTRHRRKRTGELASCKNRIIKLLEAAGFKLSRVCSDVLGASGRLMIEALIAGTQSPQEMAELARGRLRAKRSELARALVGEMSATKRWLLQALLDQLKGIERDLATLDKRLNELLLPHEADLKLLQQIPGVERIAAMTIVAEMGTDMSVFTNAKKLSSWSGLAPGSYESAGKSRNVRVLKGNRWLRTVLVEATHASLKARKSPWRAAFARIARSTGSAKKATLAVARRLCAAVFYVLRDRVYLPYDPPPPTEAAQQRAKNRAVEQLQALGFDVTLAAKPMLAPA